MMELFIRLSRVIAIDLLRPQCERFVMALGFAGLLIAAPSAFAATVQGVTLAEKGAEQVVRIDLDRAGEYQIYDLEGPARVAVSLPGYTLGKGVDAIQGQGGVDNVFPVGNADGARIEIGLTQEAKYTVSEEGNALLVTIKALKPDTNRVVGAEIDEIQVKDKGSITEIVLRGKHMDANHNAFVTNGGQTMILDFWGATSKLPKEFFQYSTQKVSSVTVGAAEDRVRLIVSMLPTADIKHQVVAESDSLIVRLGSVSPKERSAGTIVEAVDFQPDDRIAHIIIRTNETDPIVSLHEEDGAVVLDLKKGSLAAGQERSQDVSAFPGPVKQLDSYPLNGNVRIVARLRQKVEVSSFQTGNILTVNLVPEDIARAQAGAAEGESKLAYSGQKVSFDFKDIDIKNALKLIAEMSNLNIIMSDDVNGNLTMRLVDVPWDQALDLILAARGLGREQAGNVLRIAPINVLQAEYKSKLLAQEGSQKLEPLVTEFVTLSFTKVADLKKTLEGAGSNSSKGAATAPAGGSAAGTAASQETSIGIMSPRGSFLVDERTNTLIIKDTQNSINNIKRLIAVIDKPVEQVLIEARIVEATDNFSRDIGVRWGGQVQSKSLDRAGNPRMQAGQAPGTNPTGTRGFLVDLPGATAATGGAIGLTLGGVSKAFNLDLELSAAEANNEIKIISNPRVVTTNLKTATINQGTDIPFSTVSLNGTQTQFKKATLGLEVTPQITADDRIILDVTVTKDSPQAGVTTNPIINTKNITTQIFMDDGETVVIGGIYTRDASTGVAGVPLLKDIPLLGWLFKKKAIKDNREELLIFLTPKIIKAKQAISGL